MAISLGVLNCLIKSSWLQLGLVDDIINFAHYFKISIDSILEWTDGKYFDNDIKRKLDLASEDKKELAYKCTSYVMSFQKVAILNKNCKMANKIIDK